MKTAIVALLLISCIFAVQKVQRPNGETPMGKKYMMCFMGECGKFARCRDQECRDDQKVWNNCKREKESCKAFDEKLSLSDPIPDDFFKCAEECMVPADSKKFEEYECNVKCAGGDIVNEKDEEVEPENPVDPVEPEDNPIEPEEEKKKPWFWCRWWGWFC
eukprot:TRINITY_DN63968_c0_g1_i1.p2 TRINITY_DN63968_c0_g1~~TRINITY_DN63968_c0_g1_i1.p2  ORF type:complete len:169 (+),score=19.49 TRINITY_DN63968_c0_g1_i1:25-507(+)